MPVGPELPAVLSTVEAARNDPLTDHPVAARIKGPFADAVRSVVNDPTYKVEGSPGKGNGAETVWVAVFDRLNDRDGAEGFYVVYLLRKDGAGAFLSLNQATTAILRQAGAANYLNVLSDTASRDVGLLSSEDLDGLTPGPIDLAGLPGRRHSEPLLPDRRHSGEAQLETDLTRFVLLYQALVEARENIGAEETPPPVEVTFTGVEAVRYRLHRRAERSRTLARQATERSVVCGFASARKPPSRAGGLADERFS